MSELLPSINSNQVYDAADWMWQRNPELAGMVLANASGVLTPEFLPYFVHFRALQSNERIAFERELTDRLGISANVEMHAISSNTVSDVVRMNETGLTERQRIQSQYAFETSKLKYDWRRRAIEAQLKGQIHISNNELEATKIEAQAQGQMLQIISQAKKDIELGKSRHELTARLREAEVSYLSRLAEAEERRLAVESNNRTEVIKAYLDSHATLARYALMGELYQQEIAARLQLSKDDTLRKFFELSIPNGTLILAMMNERRVRITGPTVDGIEYKLDIKLGDD